MDDICAICGDSKKDKYIQTLQCNHCFHYECIQKTFQCDSKKNNLCPLCRQPHGLLPIVNGIPKLIIGIHYKTQCPKFYSSTKCDHKLISGKRKGEECGAKCMLGFNICKRHHTSILKKQSKNNLITT
jgi:hypothetical protein